MSDAVSVIVFLEFVECVIYLLPEFSNRRVVSFNMVQGIVKHAVHLLGVCHLYR